MFSQLRLLWHQSQRTADRKRLSSCYYNRGQKCVYSAIEYWTVSTRKPRSEYTLSCIILTLLWPLFFSPLFHPFSKAWGLLGRLCNCGGVKGLMAYARISCEDQRL